MGDHLDAFLRDTQSQLHALKKARGEDAEAEQIVVAIGNESAGMIGLSSGT